MTKTTGRSRALTDVSALVGALAQFHPINDALTLFLAQHTQVISLPRKKFLLKEGALCGHIYFVRKGALHAYLKGNGKEMTTWISIENNLVTSIAALFGQQPSKENIQALEPSELLMMSFEHLEQLYAQQPEVNVIARKLLQKYYSDAENRTFLIRIPKAEQRYQHFLKSHPNLANRIPLKYIASYIGITLETLSRIRGKMSGASYTGEEGAIN